MQRVKVASSNVQEVGWEAGTLEVLYLNGAAYHYHAVPESVFTALLAAPSVGTFMHGIVKPRYRCEELEEKQMAVFDQTGQTVGAQTNAGARATSQQLPSIGRIVHFVLDEGPNKGEHRPAIIVNVWGEPHPGVACQLQVFTDSPDHGYLSNDNLDPVLWKSSRTQSDGHEPGTWHFPEYVPAT